MNRERLAAFLFRMMRDEVPAGVITDHLECVERYHPDPSNVWVPGDQLSEGLALFARQVAERLVPDEETA